MKNLTEEYKKNLGKYEDFRVKIEQLIRELLIQNNINFHKIESRIKDPEGLEEKINRKNGKYNELSDITDIVGIRVITFFEDEVDKVASIIESEFVLDKNNSVDRRQLESDRFGYKSLHYIFSFTNHRKQLTEYKRFKEIKVEIQIRSILQHAWAEIEHDIGYKGEHSIPDVLKRSFYRVAALLETADIEFVNIRTKLREYESNVAETIKRHPEEVEINKASLFSFIDTDPTVTKIDQDIAKKLNFEVQLDMPKVEDYVLKLLFLNVKTIRELKEALVANETKISDFASKWVNTSLIRSLPKGISVFYLCYVLIGIRGDEKLASDYFNHFFSTSIKNPRRAESIISIYNEISNNKADEQAYPQASTGTQP